VDAFGGRGVFTPRPGVERSKLEDRTRRSTPRRDRDRRRVSGGCEPGDIAFTYTQTANFSVACPADFNADGGIDGLDVEAFVERRENGC
jgi:hypothetical protein